MLKLSNIKELINKQDVQISDTGKDFKKYYSIDGKMLFTNLQNDNKTVVSLYKFLQKEKSNYNILSNDFKTNQFNVPVRDIQDPFNSLKLDSMSDAHLVFNTGIVVPYNQESYYIFKSFEKSKGDCMIMINVLYVNCFKDCYFALNKNDRDLNILNVFDEQQNEVNAIIMGYSFLNYESEKISIKEYVNKIL